MQRPVFVFAVVEGSENDGGAVLSAVERLARDSRLEAGCIRYDLYRSQKAPVLMIIHEAWVSDEALQAHRKSLHVERFKAAIDDTTATVWASRCEPVTEGHN